MLFIAACGSINAEILQEPGSPASGAADDGKKDNDSNAGLDNLSEEAHEPDADSGGNPPQTPSDEAPPAETPDTDVEESPETGMPFAAFPHTFTASDLYGNTVTEKALGEKQMFFVHLWATWCGPCVQEMPDLAELAEEYGDRVGFIALLDDYGTNLSGAKNIAESAGVPLSFIMVDAENNGLADLMSLLSTGYIPTTVIIDGNGDLLVEPLIGAYGDEYAKIFDLIFAYFSSIEDAEAAP